MVLLSISGLTRAFGGVRAVSGFNLQVRPGELIGLMGPNGAGKTTVFNLISGIYTPDAGRIVFDDYDITGLPPYRIARLGVGRTFQNIRLFDDMTVIENVKVAARDHVEYGVVAALLHVESLWDAETRLDEYCRRLLGTVGLEDKAGQRAGALPYGWQRRLEIARALAAKPRLLLLDEPAAGMNPQETRELVETIRRLRSEFDLAVLIIEHNMHVMMTVAERIVVMDFGQIIADGTPEHIRGNPAVIEAYLGKDGSHAVER